MKNKQILASASVAVAVILGGCNSEGSRASDMQPSPPTSNVSLLAENNLVAALNTQPMQVNLQGDVQLLVDGASSDFNQASYIESVTPVDNQPESCAQIAPNDSGFSVSYDGFVGACVYQYSAANSQYGSLSADAYSLVVSEKHVSNHVDTFRHLSKTLVLGDGADQDEIQINLKDELGSDVPDGYALSTDATLVGPGSIEVETDNQTITYHPADREPGYAQIVYTYKNGGKVKLGTISVTISQSVNSAPNAPNIDYASDNDPLEIGKQATINLSGSVTDADGDSLQLVRVSSWEAHVSPTNSDALDNLSFNFMSSKPGEHFVDYVVSDHLGGFATGTVRIAVVDLDQQANWSDINILQDDKPKVFIAPLTKVEADARGVVFSGTHPEAQGNGKVINVSTFNFSQAQKYCATIGRLPTVKELQALADNSKVTAYQWPTQLPYMATDAGAPDVVKLDTGESVDPTVGGDYVTCVQDAEFTIMTDASVLTAVANNDDTAKVKVRLEKNEKPVVGAIIQGEVTGEAHLVSSEQVTDERGEAVFLVTSLKAGTMGFTASYTNQGMVQRHVDVKFVADLNNLVITDTGTRGDEIYIEVEDANHNKPSVGSTKFSTDSTDITLDKAQTPMQNGESVVRYKVNTTQSGDTEAVVKAKYETVNAEIRVPLRLSGTATVTGDVEHYRLLVDASVPGHEIRGWEVQLPKTVMWPAWSSGDWVSDVCEALAGYTSYRPINDPMQWNTWDGRYTYSSSTIQHESKTYMNIYNLHTQTGDEVATWSSIYGFNSSTVSGDITCEPK